jgi:signal transduction histidine kinase
VIPQRSPERVAGIASETLESLKAAGRLEGIRTRVDAPAGLKPINVDRVRLAAAVEQLLLNAAEAMPQGGQLTLRLSSSGGRQRLEVTDTGEGIEKKNFSSVFHPFFTTRPGKMGLGLTLARNVARAHGGTLELRSEPGRGTTAALELPEA